jgi:hypothetical protein
MRWSQFGHIWTLQHFAGSQKNDGGYTWFFYQFHDVECKKNRIIVIVTGKPHEPFWRFGRFVMQYEETGAGDG